MEKIPTYRVRQIKNGKQIRDTTMYKNNNRNSSVFKGYCPLHLSCNLTGMKSAIVAANAYSQKKRS